MPHKKAPEGYIKIPEAAKMMHVAPMTAYRYIIDMNEIPHRSEPSGARTFYYVKKKDVEKFMERFTPKPKGRPKASEYEIVVISCGKLDVLFKTKSLYELSMMYIRMMENEHKLVRIRADGQLLTIHESDKLGGAYHPRTKKGYAI